MSGYVKREGKYKDIDYDKEFFPTPEKLCLATLGLLPDVYSANYALDPGSGTGVWGKAFRKLNKFAILDGVEIDENVHNYREYSNWVTADYLRWVSNKRYDTIFGNPPFSLAEGFIRKGLSELYEGGYLAFLLRLSFLESRTRGIGLFKAFPPKYIHVLATRPSFSGDGGRGMLAYAIFIWQEGYKKDTKLHWMDWDV